MEQAQQEPEPYRAATGREYRYIIQACDWDLDHPDACLFTFMVVGSDGVFSKVIAVAPEEVAGVPQDRVFQSALQKAEAKLQQKLDAGNEADEPTPLA